LPWPQQQQRPVVSYQRSPIAAPPPTATSPSSTNHSNQAQRHCHVTEDDHPIPPPIAMSLVTTTCHVIKTVTTVRIVTVYRSASLLTFPSPVHTKSKVSTHIPSPRSFFDIGNRCHVAGGNVATKRQTTTLIVIHRHRTDTP